MKKRKCRLCGGKIAGNGICTECGYDNSASIKNEDKKESIFNSGYVILLVSAVIFTAISAGIVYTSSRNSDDTRTGEYRYSQTIEPGIYQVGSYLPQGRYCVQPEDCEQTGLEVFQYAGNRFYSVASYLFESDRTGKKKPSIQFTEGYYFIIPPGTKRGFYTDNPNKHSLRRVETEHSEEYAIESFAESGEDFTPGVYDIYYTPTSSAPLTLHCTVLHPENGEEMGVITIMFNGQSEQSFAGVPLPKGSKINFDSMGTAVKLKAAEYTYPEFYDLTWGYKK